MERYNSMYPEDYYKVGSVYCFYTKEGIGVNYKADPDLVKKYKKELEKVDTKAISGNRKFYMNLVRCAGVVVDKSSDRLYVMMKTPDDYVVKEYICDSDGVMTDGSDYLDVQSELPRGVKCTSLPKGVKNPKFGITGPQIAEDDDNIDNVTGPTIPDGKKKKKEKEMQKVTGATLAESNSVIESGATIAE